MGLLVSRILHAGYVFECDGTRILFDPIFENPFSRNCFAFPDVSFDLNGIRRERFDAVFLSHVHDDHFSLVSLDLLDRSTPIYIYCHDDEAPSLLNELGFAQVFRIRVGVRVTVGSFEIISRLALDPEIDTVLHIRAGGFEVLNVVDSWLDPATVDELLPFAPFDLILWPFQTLRELAVLSPRFASPAETSVPPEWLEQLEKLQPRNLVPSSCQFRFESWSWINRAFFPISYASFSMEVLSALPDTRLLRLDPSFSLRLGYDSVEAGPVLDWVRVGELDGVDYDFDPKLVPPSTAEVASHFVCTSEIERSRVIRFCEDELDFLLSQRNEPEKGYFAQPRRWRLALHDGAGRVERFDFRIKGRELRRVLLREDEIEWSTELPLIRLYGALEEGESLSSLYVRINDLVPSSRVSPDLLEADVLQDPLLRCLYGDSLYGYQRFQLRRLKGRDLARAPGCVD